MAKSLYTVPESLDIVTLYQQSIDLTILFKDGVLRKNLTGSKFTFEVFDYYANQTYLIVDSESVDDSKRITLGSSAGPSDMVRDMVKIKVDFIGTLNKPLEVLHYSYRLNYTDVNNIDFFVLHGKFIVLEAMNNYYEDTSQSLGEVELIFNQSTIIVKSSGGFGQSATLEYLVDINTIVNV